MYKSPYSVSISEEIAKEIVEGFDAFVMKATVGANITVDKDELIKALRYDRDQYAKGYGDGYQDGKRDALEWISVEDALPKNELETYWVYTSVGSQHSCRWTNNQFGLGVSDKWGWSIFDIPQYTVITHWMPLPGSPKETSDDY